MSNSIEKSNETIVSRRPNLYISSQLNFWSYLIVLIPSIICSSFVLFYLLHSRVLRQALNNHVLIVLLIIGLLCQLTIYPWMLYFYQHGSEWFRPLPFCLIWGFLDWGMYITQGVLFAWTSIERHILIFHDKWVSTKKKRLFLHYLPICSLLCYCLIFYAFLFFFPPCENMITADRTLCVEACLYNFYVFTLWETIVHQLVPNMIIVVCSLTLLLRVLWQKHRIHQPIQWRKHRKMTIQILAISFLYLLFSFPNTLLIFMSLCHVSYDENGPLKKCAEFFSYFIILFFPFVCLFCLPEVRFQLKRFVQRRTRRVIPTILIINHQPR